ncbi:MAG: regulatory protein RecX [Candidatus Saccharibacteria bacterium]|nr:regulatory protein RecX [Candidatus Saccharibacteria bacterium]
MKITSITQQVKTAGRYSVFVEGKYSFSLSEAVLVSSQIASGQELDAAQLSAYKKLSADDKLYSRALRYAAMRSHSEWEVRFYLQRKEAPPDFIDEALRKLRDLGLVDDFKYAQNFVHDRRLLKPTSKRKLLMELRKKRVTHEAIEAALAEDEGTDSSALIEVIARKRRQSKYQDDTKLMQFLARQGFGYDDIKRALRLAEDD